jgi:hypothetical protein
MNMSHTVSSKIKTRKPTSFAGFLLSGAVSANIIPSHRLRYRSTLAATVAERARLARFKLLGRMGGMPGAAT